MQAAGVEASKPNPQNGPGEVPHLAQITGLRGYLALWVALQHAFQSSGYFDIPLPFRILARGDAAVEVFMIISGFVITHLVLQGRETFPEYITRRFFRLYPAYVLCAFAGFLLMAVWPWFVHTAPWQSAPGVREHAQLVTAIADQSWNNWLPHLLMHATMLHGVPPDEILPLSAMTFLPAAWSISLEWQFYLVAPLVIATARSTALVVVACAVAALGFILFTKGYFGTYPVPSFLPGVIGFFVVGIGSRLLMPALAERNVNPVYVSAVSILLLICFAHNPIPIPLLVWLPFFSFLLWHRHAGALGRFYQAATASAWPLWVGTVSYSIYLVHVPIEVGLGAAALSVFSMSRPAMMAVELTGIALAVLVAGVLYRWVERPGEAFGREAARWLRRRRQTAVAHRTTPAE